MRVESIVLPVMRQVMKHERLAHWLSVENIADPYAILDVIRSGHRRRGLPEPLKLRTLDADCEFAFVVGE